MPRRIRRGASRTTHPVALLRVRRERPRRRRAAEKRDEVASFHLLELYSVACRLEPDCRIIEA